MHNLFSAEAKKNSWMDNECEIPSKRRCYSKFLLAGISKFLSYLYNNNLVNQNNVRITSDRLSFSWSCRLFSFRFSARFNRCQSFDFSLEVFFLPFKKETDNQSFQTRENFQVIFTMIILFIIFTIIIYMTGTALTFWKVNLCNSNKAKALVPQNLFRKRSCEARVHTSGPFRRFVNGW